MGKSNEFEEQLEGQRKKEVADGWQDDMAGALEFDWEEAGSPTLPGLPTSTPAPLPLPMPDTKPKGDVNVGSGTSPSLTPLPMTCEAPPTDDDRQAISHIFGELNRAAAKALNVISLGEAAIHGHLSAGEQDLARKTIDMLSRTAEAAEEMGLPLARAVKFQRVNLDGGYSSSNVRALTTQAHDILGRLHSCCKMVRAISSNKDKC